MGSRLTRELACMIPYPLSIRAVFDVDGSLQALSPPIHTMRTSQAPFICHGAPLAGAKIRASRKIWPIGLRRLFLPPPFEMVALQCVCVCVCACVCVCVSLSLCVCVFRLTFVCVSASVSCQRVCVHLCVRACRPTTRAYCIRRYSVDAFCTRKEASTRACVCMA